MIRCIIWCAVSSHAQNEPEKISLPEQETEARVYAKRSGWQVVDLLKLPVGHRPYHDNRLECPYCRLRH